jgi:hypothetical protein
MAGLGVKLYTDEHIDRAVAVRRVQFKMGPRKLE